MPRIKGTLGIKQFISYSGAAFKSLVGQDPFKNYNDGWFYPRDAVLTHLLSLDNRYKIYQTNPALGAVINKRADFCSGVEFQVVSSKDNKPLKSDPLLDLLEEPNKIQSKEDFLGQWVVLNSLDGGVLTLPLAPTGFEGRIEQTKAMFNLPMSHANLQTINSNPFTNYGLFSNEVDRARVEIQVAGIQLTPMYGELIKFYDLGAFNGKMELLNPTSRIDSLKWDVSNIEVALEAYNVLANKPGGVGIVGVGSKNANQITPLNETERKDLEEKYRNNYGLSHSKSSVVFSKASLQYTKTMVPFDELGLKTIKDDSTMDILRAFDMPKEIFSVEQDKYENKTVAERQYIQGHIAKLMRSFANRLNNYFGYPKKGKKLIVKFDHLPAFAKQNQEKADTFQKVVSPVLDLLEKGLINELQANQIIMELTGMKYEQGSK